MYKLLIILFFIKISLISSWIVWVKQESYQTPTATPEINTNVINLPIISNRSPGYSSIYDPFGPDRDCKDFQTQDQAQQFFLEAGGPNDDPHGLDRDGDGIVCENLP